MAKSRKKTGPVDEQTQKAPVKAPARRLLVVGIGSSAGGLEAMENFLENTPPDTGIAFVLVQHLDPDHKDALPELLQLRTQMKVSQVVDGEPLAPNRVYVIPPNRDMTFGGGALHLEKPSEPRGLRLPIDTFFKSLAEELGVDAIAVVLSGMGSDGTLGLTAVKAKLGLTLAQEPGDAKFESMPLSAIKAGVADLIAPARELPGKLLASLKHLGKTGSLIAAAQEKPATPDEKIIALLREKSGRDFSTYKHNTINRRVERRMGIHHFADIGKYADFLQDNPQEVELLSKELLIGVTSFFRDPRAFAALEEKVLPALISERTPGRDLRVWVPACSTGEEAYSLAILLTEALEAAHQREDRLQLFATDLDPDAIAKARSGIYPEGIAADLTPERLRRFFTKDGNRYRISQALRDAVIFATHNLITDPPFTKLDLLSCRNLLIYLNSEQQKKLLPLFHYSLNPGGVLFLGTAETAGGFPELFVSVESQWKLYRRREDSVTPATLDFPSNFLPAGRAANRCDRTPPGASLKELVEQVLLKELTPPSALISDQGDVLYIHGRTGRFLEPAAGKANLNVFAMAREGLRHDLWNAVQKAHLGLEKVVRKSVRVKTNGHFQLIDLTVKPLKEPPGLDGLLLVTFEDAPKLTGRCLATHHAGKSTKAEELEQELKISNDAMEIMRAQMQNSQEELKSSYEEMQSTNEELQSTNEELTTSKEEMQSLNEELISVNAEMQAKIDELSRTGNDMKNLLESTDIATLFLDGSLKVRRYTSATAKIVKLIPGDLGRPITDLVIDLDYPVLAEDVNKVLQDQALLEKEAATGDGRWYQVRIMPYRTFEDKTDGAVITFSDITVAKRLEQALREAQAVARRRIGKLETALNPKPRSKK